MSSFPRKSLIDDDALRTFFQGFLGATTFGTYTQVVILEPMKQANKEQIKIIEKLEKINHELKTINYNQKQTIEHLETKLNQRWWW